MGNTKNDLQDRIMMNTLGSKGESIKTKHSKDGKPKTVQEVQSKRQQNFNQNQRSIESLSKQ